ncbi:hypothetical protein [Granulicella sibirica]|uniref:DUF4380 domain-containing protein n=1 Tax=Granulicella sibirica TaxID=2479048 RepID=A0A4Q0SUH2_9BACT|nr:hypothetical protein [Granulicella sibirica]RXH54367.1 hypothetical protein GRAN_4663 [Granulicella sibirica]
MKHLLSLALALGPLAMYAQTPCSVHPVTYQGWEAQEVTNQWLKLTVVPQLGGRLMQVEFDGHPYLFVNPKFRGQYISPTEAKGGWINYGGDKIWPMPEGDQDDHHWVLASTAIDDLPYAFKVLSQGKECAVQLDGQPDTITGLQYSRTITISATSPEIHFHAVTKNAATHPIEWSVQSVSQYDLSDHTNPTDYNHDLYAYTPAKPNSTYPDGYHVRSGLADDPSFSIQKDLFQLHWKYFENEVWLDSPAGWLAVLDRQSHFGMIEHFTYIPAGNYPGKATTIFYKNGPGVRFDKQDHATIPDTTQLATPYYMEAEINSPIVKLAPNQTYAFDTTWSPIYTTGTPISVNPTGLVTQAFTATAEGTQLTLTGTVTAFAPGTLVLSYLNQRGAEIEKQTLGPIAVGVEAVIQQQGLTPPAGTKAIALKLVDQNNKDLGILARTDIRK